MDLSLSASSQGTEHGMKKKTTILKNILMIIWLKISFQQVMSRWAPSAEGRLKPEEV